jgi:hypothetical protein
MLIPIDYNGSFDVPFGVPVKADYAPNFRVEAEKRDFFVKKYSPEPKNCALNRARRGHFLQKQPNFTQDHGHNKSQ